MKEPINCFVCSTPFKPRKYGVAKYCSSKCRKIAKKRRCIDQLKKECAICGIIKDLESHHIDENKDNNLDSNLITLCSTHHKVITRYNHKTEVINSIVNKGKILEKEILKKFPRIKDIIFNDFYIALSIKQKIFRYEIKSLLLIFNYLYKQGFRLKTFHEDINKSIVIFEKY